VYDSKNLGDNVERVLGYIAWLLEKVQKLDSAVNLGGEREVKKVKSLNNIAKKSN